MLTFGKGERKLHEETPAEGTARVSVTRPAWMLQSVVQTAQHPCLTVRVCLYYSAAGSTVKRQQRMHTQ
jgi:hypothetical protein